MESVISDHVIMSQYLKRRFILQCRDWDIIEVFQHSRNTASFHDFFSSIRNLNDDFLEIVQRTPSLGRFFEGFFLLLTLKKVTKNGRNVLCVRKIDKIVTL